MDYDNTDFLVTKTFFISTNAYCGQLLEGVDYQALPPPIYPKNTMEKL